MPNVQKTKTEIRLEGVRKDALRFVNRCRKATGMKPLEKMPKGELGDPLSCPIAKGINHGIEVKGHLYGDSKKSIRALLSIAKKLGLKTSKGFSYDETVLAITVGTPKEAGRFIDAFDNEKFPDLILKERA